MSRFSNFIKHKNIPFMAGLAVAALVFLGVSSITANKVYAAADCDSNAIIYCGYTSPSNFIAKVRGNDSGNGHNDLQSVYATFGLTPSDYDNFAAHAVAGTAYKDGRIVVDGKTVATEGKTLGREPAGHTGPGMFTKLIRNHTFYGNTNGRAFASDGLPVYVLFDGQGTMKFAAIKSCGNPEIATPVKTAASCQSLKTTPVPGQPNAFDFTATVNLTGNAKVNSFVFTFGDGHTQTIKSSATTVTVRHTYAAAAKSYTAKVTEFVSVPGNDNLQLPAVATCTKIVVVSIPACVQLTGAILDKSKFQYSFTATANFGSGVTFTGADFTFGDGKSQTGVKPNGTAATVSHTYAEAGKYNIAATLHFSVSGKPYTARTCTASVTPTTPPTPTCKPGVPVGSPECQPPCQPGSSVPPESAECQPPELPNTGAGNVVAVFGLVAVGGFLVYRQVLYRKHKKAFLAAERGTSPLPLGDPLNDQPAATPPTPKRSSFRRKRPF
jgi:hypothetical protein